MPTRHQIRSVLRKLARKWKKQPGGWPITIIGEIVCSQLGIRWTVDNQYFYHDVKWRVIDYLNHPKLKLFKNVSGKSWDNKLGGWVRHMRPYKIQ